MSKIIVVEKHFSSSGHRRLVQVIPDPMQEWWNKWELQGLIWLSLVLQIILILLVNRTKYKPNIWTQSLLWSSYLLADWVVVVAAGVISSNLEDYYNKGEKSKNVNPHTTTNKTVLYDAPSTMIFKK